MCGNLSNSILAQVENFIGVEIGKTLSEFLFRIMVLIVSRLIVISVLILSAFRNKLFQE